MDQQERPQPGEDRGASDSEAIDPKGTSVADKQEAEHDTNRHGNKTQNLSGLPNKERWKALQSYLIRLRSEGPDRHIELLLTIAIAFFAGCQLVITRSNNKSTSAQVDKMITAANWLWHSKVAHFGSLFWPTLG